MRLDPQLQAIRERLEREPSPRLYTMPIEDARAADLASIQAGAGQGEPVGNIHERTIPGPAGGQRIRVYQPAGEGPWPVLVYYFGGGWSLGTLDTCDGVCRMLTNAAPCVTVAVSYRLAPEHKFPAAVADCYSGAAWVAAHASEFRGDPARVAVGGDSSGGNLAAAVTLLAREKGGPVFAHQLLVYPNTDFQSATTSLREASDAYFFNAKAVEWYWGMYLAREEDGVNPLASPLRVASLAGLPPATVITAEYDPLRNEAEAYAARLAEAGVPVDLTRYSGVVHGFFTMIGVLDVAREAVGHAARRLRDGFAAG
jgi:acetyl esterase/lipase